MNYLLISFLGLLWGFIAYKISDFYAIDLEQNWLSGQLKIHRMLKKILTDLTQPIIKKNIKNSIIGYMALSSSLTIGFCYLIELNDWPKLLMLLALLLILLSIIDLRSKLLPNQFTYPLILFGIIFNFSNQFIAIENVLFAIALGFLMPYLLNRVYVMLRKKTGMGLGDAKLYAGIGAWLGVYYLFSVFVIASLINLIVIIYLMLRGQLKLDTYLPHGPIISLATFLSLIFIP